MTTLGAYVGSELTADLEWREAELAVMRKQLYLTTKGSLQERVLMRASVAMVYAHYEGFCKLAISSYLDAVSKLKIRRKDLNFKLAAYSLAAFRAELKETSSNEDFFGKFLLQFNASLEEIADLNPKIETSNLWPRQLIDWLSKLSLGWTEVESVETLLESLVRNRNQIAHGNKLVVSSRGDLDNLSNAATTAMHKVAVEVVEALEAKTFRRLAVTQTAINHAV